MKLTRENIRINLQGKDGEELTDIYNLLVSLKQDMYNSLERDLINLRDWKGYEFYNGRWCLSDNVTKTKVTIEQLKEILKPKEVPLEQQLQKAEAEVKRLKEAIEYSKIKVGDWVVNTRHGSVFKNDTINLGINHPNRYKKITNLQLIELLEQEIK